MIEQNQSIQPVNQAVGKPAQTTTAMLTIRGSQARITDNSGSYDVIASSPQVKQALSALGDGAYVANLTGKPYPRQSGETGFETTKLQVEGKLDELSGAATRPHGPGSAWVMQVGGKSYELHPETDSLKIQLDQQGVLGRMQVVGLIDGDHINVWQVNAQRVPKPPMRAPVLAPDQKQSDAYQSVGGQQNKYC